MAITATRAGDDLGPNPRSVPDVVAPPPRHPRFPLVDGMRAIAVLSVLVVHAAVMGQGVSESVVGRALAHLNIGVTIFFLISGFLLYRPFIAHRSGGAETPRIRDYAKRRFLRIYPAYWVALSVLVIIPGLTGVVDGAWLPMYALVHRLNGDGGCVEAIFDCGLAHTWSLVVEVTFYAALPLYAMTAARVTRALDIRGWVRAELGLLAGLSVLSIALQFLVYESVPEWLGASALGYLFWFALGMGMAVISVRCGSAGATPRPIRSVRARPEVPWLMALALYGLLCAWLPADTFLYEERDMLVAHVGFGIVAALLLAPAVFSGRSAGLPGRVLAQPVVAWLGLVSYGIFLWHYVVTIELGIYGEAASFPLVLLATLAISIPVAALSYYVVERPLLRLKYRRLRKAPPPGSRPPTS